MPRSPSSVPPGARGSGVTRREPVPSAHPPSELESNPGAPFDLVTLKHAVGEAAYASQPARNYRPGDVIAGKYKLLRVLGQGGMSSVWAVQNLVLDAQFALKLIRNDDGDAHAAERMLREARSAARLEHPGIIRMFDFGVTDRGDPFLVMDLLTAPSIREKLRTEGPISPAEAVRLLLPIAEALSVVHAHGIVHRDLKPDNIVCVPAGIGRCQPKLIDFGIAKQLGDESSRITQVGVALGSPEYMSPEQALGLSDVDHRTDIWSFCVVLYEMMTGITPFARGDDLAAILRAIVDDPVPPIADYGVYDRELWAILSRGFAKFPGGRWIDMHALGVALARWLLHQGIEEDVCMQSLRMVWLGTSSSVPPVAVDTREAERARLAALSSDVDLPKRGLARTLLGVAAAVSCTALIAVAGIHAARSSGKDSQGAGIPEHASRASIVEPSAAAPVPGAPTAAAPFNGSQPDPATSSRIAPPTEDPPNAAKRSPEPPRATADSASAQERNEPKPERRAGDPTATEAQRALKASSGKTDRARAEAPPPTRRHGGRQAPKPSPIDDLKIPSATLLPDVKPPPDFGAATPSDSAPNAPRSSDNPYGDTKPIDKPSDNPYVDGTD